MKLARSFPLLTSDGVRARASHVKLPTFPVGKSILRCRVLLIFYLTDTIPLPVFSSLPVSTSAILTVSASMEQDRLDSSDWEFDAGPANPFAQAGKASIEAIIQNATRDRFTSKKTSKQLVYVKGSRKTQYVNNLWYERFQAFRQHTLKLKYVFPLSCVLHSYC